MTRLRPWLPDGTLIVAGGVAERSNAAVSKTVSGGNLRRGFKSLPLRSFCANPLLMRVCAVTTSSPCSPPESRKSTDLRITGERVANGSSTSAGCMSGGWSKSEAAERRESSSRVRPFEIGIQQSCGLVFVAACDGRGGSSHRRARSSLATSSSPEYPLASAPSATHRYGSLSATQSRSRIDGLGSITNPSSRQTEPHSLSVALGRPAMAVASGHRPSDGTAGREAFELDEKGYRCRHSCPEVGDMQPFARGVLGSDQGISDD
jgi:hypothetical protein